MTLRIETAVHAYLRAGAGDQAPRTGPFLMHYDAHNDGRFFNYAIPDDGAAPTPDEVAALAAEFDARHRIPRLEYLPGRCPHLEPALLAAGFTAEARLPVLTCRPEDAAEPGPAPVELLLAATDEELYEVAGAQAEAYGQAAASGHDVARLRRVQGRGGLVALARDTGTGRGVGGGQCGPPHRGVSEVAAVGVRAAHRRRGIGAALTALLTRSCPSAGITTPFLMTLDEPELRLYSRVGYRVRTRMLHISRPG